MPSEAKASGIDAAAPLGSTETASNAKVASHTEASPPGSTETPSHVKESAPPAAAHVHHVPGSWLAVVYDPGYGAPINRIGNAADAVRNVDRYF